MDEWAWINGDVTRVADARVSIEDRGFQFADGVYEFIRLYNGSPFALERHLDRLEQSCLGIQLNPPERVAVVSAIDSVLYRSRLTDGMVYLQFTRGHSPRNHVFPPVGTKGTLVCYARKLDPTPRPEAVRGIELLSVPDDRWKRCWVKSIALLPNVLAKSQASSVGADEAVFVDEGIVTECSTSNLFVVSKGTLMTHPVGPKVLPGVTRGILLEIAATLRIAWQECRLTELEAQDADEVFISSTAREINWVSAWNGRQIADRCGEMGLRLHREFQKHVAGTAR